MTQTLLYKIYREILFQKVALGYLLHFVQNGSSEKRTKEIVFDKHDKKSENSEKCLIYSPLTPDQPPFKGGLYVTMGLGI